MQFQILSHAGLLVRGAGVTLVCDPWIIGSTHWRSWWNYPPVPREIVTSLRPDFIYLTHIHWDHFQGVSLRHLGKHVPILIPRCPNPRMLRDLTTMGFESVREISHGETVELAPGFRITSHHFHVFLDSALVIETEGRTLLNANDCKIMGWPLRHLLSRHGKIDFVFRSHSSANARLCYEIIDDPTAQVDDPQRYVRDFTEFARAVDTEVAVPFASNACYLHKDVFHFNDRAITPMMVKEYVESQGVEKPRIQIMIAGDTFDDAEGFSLQEHDWFDNREARIEEYRESVRPKLEATYEREANTVLRLPQLERYFSKAFDAMPWLLRRLYRDTPVLYVLSAGDNRTLFEVDFHRKRVRELDRYEERDYPLQIHTAAALMRRCMLSNLFTHLAISKRVRYRVTAEKKHLMVLLNLFYNFYEYEMLPVRRMLTSRFVSAWIRRYRELFFWAHVALDFGLRRGFDMTRYLPAPRRAPALEP